MPGNNIQESSKRFVGPYWRKQIFFVTAIKKIDDSVVLIHATNDEYKRTAHGTMLELSVGPEAAAKLATDGEFLLVSHRVKHEFFYLYKNGDEEIQRLDYERESFF